MKKKHKELHRSGQQQLRNHHLVPATATRCLDCKQQQHDTGATKWPSNELRSSSENSLYSLLFPRSHTSATRKYRKNEKKKTGKAEKRTQRATGLFFSQQLANLNTVASTKTFITISFTDNKIYILRTEDQYKMEQSLINYRRN